MRQQYEGDRFSYMNIEETAAKFSEVPCVYLHARESAADTGVYLCAATREQAERAVRHIGENCKLTETSTSDHAIHAVHSETYIAALSGLLPKL